MKKLQEPPQVITHMEDSVPEDELDRDDQDDRDLAEALTPRAVTPPKEEVKKRPDTPEPVEKELTASKMSDGNETVTSIRRLDSPEKFKRSLTGESSEMQVIEGDLDADALKSDNKSFLDLSSEEMF